MSIAREFFAMNVLGGITSVLQGGKFGHGFSSAFLGAVIGQEVGGFSSGSGITLKNLGKFITKATLSGTVSEITGGKFANGAKATAFLVALQGLPALYEKTVGYELDMGSGGDAVQKTESTPPVEGANNIGTQGGNVDNPCAVCEGGGLSETLNQVPGINAVAGAHDVMQVSLGDGLARDVLNVPGMIPSAAFTYTAALGQPLTYLNTGQILSIATTYSRNKERDRDRQLPYILGY